MHAQLLSAGASRWKKRSPDSRTAVTAKVMFPLLVVCTKLDVVALLVSARRAAGSERATGVDVSAVECE